MKGYNYSMVTARHAATINVPVDVAWRRLADLASWPRWLLVPYASESLTITSAPPTGQGSEFTLKGRLPYRLFARVVEWQEARLLSYEIYRSEYPSDRLFFRQAVIRVQLEPIDSGRTAVRCSHTLEGRGFAGRLYAATVMRPFISTNVQRIVDGLRGSP